MSNDILGSMPRGLSPLAKTIWKTYAPQLEEMGKATNADRPIFQTFVESYSWYTELRKQAMVDGPIVVGHKGVKSLNPLLRAADKEFDKWFACAQKLGLSPESRRKNGINIDDTSFDELAAFSAKRTPQTLKGK